MHPFAILVAGLRGPFVWQSKMDLQGGPTFEDLSIDDELSQLQRVVRYSSSSIALQRLVHVKVRSLSWRLGMEEEKGVACAKHSSREREKRIGSN